jgi:hypothetical protein
LANLFPAAEAGEVPLPLLVPAAGAPEVLEKDPAFSEVSTGGGLERMASAFEPFPFWL